MTLLRFQRVCLGVALLLAPATLLFGGLSLWNAVPDEGWARWARVTTETLGLFSLNAPSGDVAAGWYVVARLCAAGFVVALALGATGVFFSLYHPALDTGRRFWMWATRARPTVVIGLGWIGGPLAASLAREGRSVIGVALDGGSVRAEAAREAGVLVVVGDATDADVRAQLKLKRAREVFIATGRDALNVEIAGDLLDDARADRLDPHDADTPLVCYIHIGAPAKFTAFQDHGLFQRRNDALDLRAFSTTRTAARQLLLGLRDETQPVVAGTEAPRVALARPGGCVPAEGEVLHVFVLGFGAMGQEVALHTARLAHFANGLRTRLTLIDYFDDPVVGRARAAFQERHPRFWHPYVPPSEAGTPEADAPADDDPTDHAPADGDLEAVRDPAWGVDLGAPSVRAECDAWAWRPTLQRTDIEPSPKEVWLRGEEEVALTRPADYDTAEEDPEGWRRATPVAYAANAEFYTLTGIVEARAHLNALVARLRPEQPDPAEQDSAEPRVQPALVVCFEDDERTVAAALRLRDALSRALPPTDADGAADVDPGRYAPVCPIYVYLPVEEGLEALVNPPRCGKNETPTAQQIAAERFPIYPFGQRRHAASYKAITLGGERELAVHLARSHAALSGKMVAHPDFNLSNLEAALHAMIKLDTLKLETSRRTDKLVSRAWHPTPLLHPLIKAEETERRWRRWHGYDPDGTEPLSMTLVEFRGCDEALRQRLALLERVESRHPSERVALEQAVAEAREQAVRLFEHTLESIDPDSKLLLDRIADMEHSRYMGERLCRGWSFGEKSNLRKQRPSFVLWNQLHPATQFYDRVQLPAHVLGLAEKGYFTYAPRAAPEAAVPPDPFGRTPPPPPSRP